MKKKYLKKGKIKVEINLSQLGFEVWNDKTKQFEKPSEEYIKSLPNKSVTLH